MRKLIVFRRLLICYLSFIIVTAFCLSQVIYSVMSKRYTETITDHQRDTFSQSVNFISDVNSEIDGMVSYIISSSIGFSSLYGSTTDYLNDYQLMLSLKQIHLDHSPFRSIAIFNANTNHLLSTQSYPESFINKLKNGVYSASKQVVFIPNSLRKSPGQYEDQIVIVANPGTFINKKSSRSLVIFCLNTGYLSDKLTSISLPPQKLYLLCPDGTVLYDGNDSLFFSEEDSQILLQQFLGNNILENEFQRTISNEKNMFFFTKTNLADCVLLSRISLSQITEPLTDLRNTVNLLTVLSTIIVCGIGSFIIYRLYYKPIASLLKTINSIRPETDEHRSLDELSLLNDSFIRIQNEVAALKSNAEGALSSIRKTYLSSLLYVFLLSSAVTELLFQLDTKLTSKLSSAG